MSNLEEEVAEVVLEVINQYDFKDIIENEISNLEVMTKGNFDPSDYDVLNADEVEYKIEEVVSYKVEEMMGDENSSFLARIEKLEDKLLAVHRLLGHAADVITYLNTFQKGDAND